MEMSEEVAKVEEAAKEGSDKATVSEKEVVEIEKELQGKEDAAR